jgi:acyl-CoA thioester hydrolase
VRCHEVDPQEIVFNSRYLEYLDVAMTEWFRSLGWDYPALVKAGCDPSLVSLRIDWHRPARFDEELDVTVRVERIGRSSYTLAYDLNRAADAELLATATVVYVNYDGAADRAQALPEAVRERLTLYRELLGIAA